MFYLNGELVDLIFDLYATFKMMFWSA